MPPRDNLFLDNVYGPEGLMPQVPIYADDPMRVQAMNQYLNMGGGNIGWFMEDGAVNPNNWELIDPLLNPALGVMGVGALGMGVGAAENFLGVPGRRGGVNLQRRGSVGGSPAIDLPTMGLQDVNNPTRRVMVDPGNPDGIMPGGKTN